MNKLFENKIEAKNILFKHANGKSSESGKEFHIYHEIIYFIDGNAEFIGESIHINITPGTLIVIPKETYHRMIIHGNKENYHRCIINLYDNPDIMSLIDKCMTSQTVLTADKDTEFLFNKLTENTNDENARLYLNAVVVLLLDKIAENSAVGATENRQNFIVKNALEYINNNIDKKLTIDKIAKECMVSESSLSHIFKKELNITLHKFIIKKKLINAYNKINAGMSSTSAAIECGFNDYSGFYKQYKKMFNVTPSETSSKSVRPPSLE